MSCVVLCCVYTLRRYSVFLEYQVIVLQFNVTILYLDSENLGCIHPTCVGGGEELWQKNLYQDHKDAYLALNY